MSYSVSVDGNAVFIEASSLTIDNTIGRRSSASFTAKTDTNTHFRDYQQVSIYDDSNTLIFSGYITNPKEQKSGFSNILEHSIQCCDQHYLADKRLVAASFTNKTCGYIAQWLVTNILSQEGVTVGQIYDGLEPSPTLYPSSTLYPLGNVGLIPQASFVYCTVASALDELVKQASSAGIPYYWMIDQNKKLWFVPYTAIVNSTIVDGTLIDQVSNAPSVQRQNQKYRNTQYVLGGVAQTLTQTETRMGDSNTQAWTMGFDLASAPTITVNSTGQTIGIKGTTGAQFYWAQGDPIVVQDSGQTKLTSGDTLQVVYIGQYPSVAIAQDGGSVTSRAILEGGGTTGIVEEVETDNTLINAASGLSEAGQLLAWYTPDGIILQFTMKGNAPGYGPGQLITVNLPEHNLYNAQMLIDDVSASDQQDGFNIWITVTAIQGPYDQNWQFFFAALVKQNAIANSINLGINQQLTVLASFTASISPSATLTVTPYSCPLPSPSLYPHSALYPC
jgi:hypothetical protein